MVAEQNIKFLMDSMTERMPSVEEQSVTLTKVGDSNSYLYDPGDFKFTVTKEYYADDFKLYLRVWTNTAEGGSSGKIVNTNVPFSVTNDGDHYTVRPLATIINSPYGMSTRGTLALNYTILIQLS